MLLSILCLLFVGCATHSLVASVHKPAGNPEAYAEELPSMGYAFDQLSRNIVMPTVYFKKNSSEIDYEYADTLSGYIRIAEQYAMTCSVDGYASEEGSNDYNLALSGRRAGEVAAYLRSFSGLASVKDAAYGEERQISKDRVLNRRVEVTCEQ